MAGYTGAGDSADTSPKATKTVTATSTATGNSPVGEPDTTKGRRPGEIPGDGTYVIGKDIKPGTYRTEGPQGGLITDCYWARLSSTSGESNDIIASEVTKGRTTVTIDADDKAFTTNGCRTWKKVD
ncbi:hypothetical protein [Streptomyces sp. HD]|uniref:hypothetical protein n=1 Tax=Streptomyces sp. HD TaxID=3020892 RepID=UPI002330B7AE|nr:hypothetical protein [Streptomyces sp. HD]MDC0769580.1 hypothetical protein [Streptomyces sp. HD]